MKNTKCLSQIFFFSTIFFLYASVPARDIAQATNKVKTENSSMAGNDFNSILTRLILGAKDNYASLKGKLIDSDYGEYECTINLPGAESTSIVDNGKGVRVWIGRYETLEEAAPVFIKYSVYLSDYNSLPCELALSEYYDEGELKFASWNRTDDKCEIYPGNVHFYMELKVVSLPIPKNVKQGDLTLYYTVILNI